MATQLTHEDMAYIKGELDERYVKQTTCDETQRQIAKKFSNDDKRIELLVKQQQINNWLTGAIASGIIALLIKVFLGG